jgi:hypothetical protein
MTVWVADAHAHVQRLVSAVRIATVFECITEEQRSVVRLLWAKGLIEKGIHKEIFPVYIGKCLSCKAVPPGWQNFADEEVETEMRKWLRQSPKASVLRDSTHW